MYEVEIKVELTKDEREKLMEVFKEKNFAFKGMTPQNDIYIEAKDSPYALGKGFDLKRYRHEADKYIYTEKIWELIDDKPVRRENEHAVTQGEYETETKKYPNAVKILKDREWFAGKYSGGDISITIDTVKFDHSPSTRYFIEAEVDTENKAEVLKTKEAIKEFLKEILRKPEITESPGMFQMAFKKL